jgi:hypothetical protein
MIRVSIPFRTVAIPAINRDIFFPSTFRERRSDVKDVACANPQIDGRVLMPSQQSSVTYNQIITPTSGDMIQCGRRYWESMRVAGTIMDCFAIYGTWSAVSYIDGVQVATTAFEITP